MDESVRRVPHKEGWDPSRDGEDNVLRVLAEPITAMSDDYMACLSDLDRVVAALIGFATAIGTPAAERRCNEAAEAAHRLASTQSKEGG